MIQPKDSRYYVKASVLLVEEISRACHFEQNGTSEKATPPQICTKPMGARQILGTWTTSHAHSGGKISVLICEKAITLRKTPAKI